MKPFIKSQCYLAATDVQTQARVMGLYARFGVNSNHKVSE